MIDADVTEELLDLERGGWDALCDGTGDDYYGSLMTDDGLMVLANGQVMTRGEVVASLADAPTWDSYEITNARTVELGRDTIALVYLGTARRAGADEFVAAMTSVYVRDADGWSLALYQQTPVS